MKTIAVPARYRTNVLALGTALAVATTVWALNPNRKAEPLPAEERPPVNLVVDARPLDREGRSTTSFSPVVKKVSPSVVRVETVARARTAAAERGPQFGLPWFRGPRGNSDLPFRPDTTPRQRGMGSGVIVTADGYLLTNHHVVDGADEVKVSLPDGREFNAKVVGKDPKTDVAVLKIEATDLPFLELADSDLIEVGDLVLAVGNPFGIGQTVTMGMVSAKDRATLGLDYEDFIQTDAAINPGNSGGALVDVEGRLVGINTAILSRSGGNQGIGFAIPTNLARQVMESLVQEGRVVRGYLGVLIQDLTPALAKAFALDDLSGALVGGVTPRGPAEKAGLKTGDVVREFNGRKVRDSRQLKLEVGHTRPGQTVAVQVFRDGSLKTLKVTLRELPDEDQLARSPAQEADTTGTLAGVGVADLDREVRRQLRVPDGVRGAAVTEVRPESAAYEAGLRPGDVIVELNRQPVESADEVVQLTENSTEKRTLLRIWSRGGSRFVVVDESKAS
jgi:serine protease Do